MELLDKESYHIGHLPAQATSAVAGRVLSDIADTDDRIAVFTADLKYSNGTIEFEERHPNRFFNVGIAEQNMVSMAAGMAATGHITYVATFASFLGLLCCEQIRTCAAYTNLPVRLLGHHSGISFGYYGSSHHATEDIGIMRGIANLGVVCPCDAHSFEQALIQTVDVEGPFDTYIEACDGNCSQPYIGRIYFISDGSTLINAMYDYHGYNNGTYTEGRIPSKMMPANDNRIWALDFIAESMLSEASNLSMVDVTETQISTLQATEGMQVIFEESRHAQQARSGRRPGRRRSG